MKPSTPQARFTAGQKALAQGDVAGARATFEALLTLAPNSVEVMFELARCDVAEGKRAEARTRLEKAAGLRPGEASIWVEWAKLCRRNSAARQAFLGSVKAALPAAVAASMGKIAQGQVVDLPAPPKALQKDLARARKLAKAGQRSEAAKVYGQAAKAHVAGVQAFGAAMLEGGDAAGAGRAAADLLKRAPLATPSHIFAARVAEARGKPTEALVHAMQAAELAPKAAETVDRALRLALGLGRVDRARGVLDAALADGARRSGLILSEARVLLEEGRPRSAAALVEAPGRNAAFWEVRARALSGSGYAESALEAWAEVRRLDARTPYALAHAEELQSLGRSGEAETLLRDVLAREPGNASAFRALAYGAKLAWDDPAVQAAREVTGRAPLEAALVQNALAKVAHDAGKHAEVFGLLDTANGAFAKAYPYDIPADEAEVGRTLGPITQTLAGITAHGPDAPAPILITGMPRSGTTLIEQILGAHGAVTAGGELAVMHKALAPVLGQMTRGQLPEGDTFEQVAEAYVAGVAEKLVCDTPHFTDKSIHSFVHAGVIQKALPSARIVVVHRDPRDVALSIYRNHFAAGTQRYSTRLDWIAHHVGIFQCMVAHWRKIMGDGLIEVTYEDLLADPEAETRKLVAACGLAWDPACLAFHERAGRVKTLSFAQARQPIYGTSKGGWRRYEAELQTFVEACAKYRVKLPS